MGRYDLALIGFGGVNGALAELISQRGHHLAENLGFDLRVVAITICRPVPRWTPTASIWRRCWPPSPRS